jgi:hypothetical protein
MSGQVIEVSLIPSNMRGNSMFLRLNLREARLLKGLANDGPAEFEARTLKRLQGLGLVNRNLLGSPAEPVTPYGIDWIRSNPTAPLR